MQRVLGRVRETRNRPSESRTVELALEAGQHKSDGLGSAGGGGHNVQGGGASAAQVAVACVQQALVSCVGVGCGHCSLDNAELLIQHLSTTNGSFREPDSAYGNLAGQNDYSRGTAP